MHETIGTENEKNHHFYACKRSIYVVGLLGLKITGKRPKLLPLGREWN